EDLVKGLLFVQQNSHETINLFNLAPSSVTSVKTIVKMILEATGNANTKVQYTGGVKGGGGWLGDVPRVQLDARKAYKLGWTPKFSSDEAVAKTISAVIKEIG